MALEIFRLVGSVFVDNNEANNSLARTDEKAQSVGRTFMNGVATVGKWSAALVGGAVAVGAGMVKLASDTATAADTIDKASVRMGISAEYYQQLAYAADQCGVSTSDLEQAAKKLEGTDLNFEDAIEQIMALETAEERSALATELFGERVAYNLTPMLEEGGETVNELMQQCSELGMVMSQEDVDAGVQLNDTLNTIKGVMQSLVLQVGSAIIPAVQTVADLLIMLTPTIQAILQSILPVIQQLANGIIPLLMTLINTILTPIVTLLNLLLPPVTMIVETVLGFAVELLNLLLPPLISIVTMLLPVLVDILTPIFGILEPILGLLEPIIQILVLILDPLLELIDFILPPIIELLVQLITLIADGLGWVLEWIAGWIEERIPLIKELIMMVIEQIKWKIEEFVEIAKEKFEIFKAKFLEIKDNVVIIVEALVTIFENFKTNFGNTFAALVDLAKAPINTVLGFVNDLIDAINSVSFDIPDWVPNIGGGSFGFNIPNVPYLANGGSIVGGGSAVVGEAGAELIDLPAGAKVTPLQGGNGGGTIEQKIDTLLELLTEIRDANVELPDAIGSMSITFDKRELGRVVKGYA